LLNLRFYKWGGTHWNQFDDDGLTPMIFNDFVHEVLGSKGNFCGSKTSHIISDLEKEVERLNLEVKHLRKTITKSVSKILYDAAVKELEDRNKQLEFKLDKLRGKYQALALHHDAAHNKEYK
jgi:chaperonin cofactor prefoldin